MPAHGSPPLLSGIGGSIGAFLGQFGIVFWASAIELVGAVIIVAYVIAALWALVRRQGINHGITRARLLVAEGAVWGLSFKVAATLLKTLTIQTWSQFGTFLLVFALRFVVKKVFAAEEVRAARLEAASRGGVTPDAVPNEVPRSGLIDVVSATRPRLAASSRLSSRLWAALPRQWRDARTYIAERARSLRV